MFCGDSKERCYSLLVPFTDMAESQMGLLPSALEEGETQRGQGKQIEGFCFLPT